MGWPTCPGLPRLSDFRTKVLCPRNCLSPRQSRRVGHPEATTGSCSKLPAIGASGAEPGLPVARRGLRTAHFRGDRPGHIFGDNSHQVLLYGPWSYSTQETVREHLDQGLANFCQEPVAVSSFVSHTASVAGPNTAAATAQK